MKLNKLLLVSIILLAILTFGAVNAAENTDADNFTAVNDGGSLDITSSVVDEMELNSDVASDDWGDDADENMEKNVKTDTKLGASNSDVLGEDYEVITQQDFYERGWNDRVMSGNYKFEGEFDGLPDYIYVDGGSIIDATGAKFINTGLILLEPDVQITGLSIDVTKHLIDENGEIPDGTVVYLGPTDNNKLTGLTINYEPSEDDHDAYAIVIDNAIYFELKNSEITLNGSSLYDNYEYAMKIMGATNGLIEENIIRANLPILDVDFDKGEPGLATDLVLTVGVQEANDIDFIGNTFIANVIDRNGLFATLDCVMIENSNNINIIGNTFNETDFFTREGENNYLNVLDIYYSSNVLVQGNKISVETTGGSENAGTSYPIQLTGPYENMVIDGNELYSNCAGPALGIYSQNYYGDTEILVQNNKIDVTGLPTYNSWGLVSGIELQDNYARVYNNTITTRPYNGYYEDGMNLYGISYAQSLNNNHQYDIRDNVIVTEGEYAIYLLQAADTIITGNSLTSNHYQGDEAIYIKDYSGNLEIHDNMGSIAFYVSEYGDDYAQGTEADPFRTIARALDEVRAVLGGSEGKSGIVYLLEGTYTLTENIDLVKTPASIIGKNNEKTFLDLDKNYQILMLGASINKLTFENINFINVPQVALFVFEGQLPQLTIENCIFNIDPDRKEELIILDGVGNFNLNKNVFLSSEDILKIPFINIYKGQFNVNAHYNAFNSIIPIVNGGEGLVNASYNYWGTNDFHDILTEGYYMEDIGKIVIATLSIEPSLEILAGSQANITVDFNHYYDIATDSIVAKDNLIPNGIQVQFKADEGKLGEEYVAVENGKATTTYVNDLEGTDVIIAILPYQELGEKINIIGGGELSVTADDTWLGKPTTIYVTALGQSGNVQIKLNGKSFGIVPLEGDGIATLTVKADDLIAGENTVEAILNGISASSTFNVRVYDLDGIVTKETFFNYFNKSNSYRLCDYIPEGATLDFRGYFNSTSEVSYVMEINKPINMISTTKDAFINLNTISTDFSGQNPGDRFTVSFNGSGTNISDITFYNSQLWFTNTHNLNINNLTSIVENRQLGSGVGVTAFRNGSSNIKVSNSYFSTKDNGGHSNFVLTNASYVTVDNCTIKGQGMVGNLIYLNLYNLDLPDGIFLPEILSQIKSGQITINDHNTFTNCKVYGPDNAMAICNTFREMGSGFTTIENTTFIYKNNGNGVAIIGGSDMVLRNVTVIGGSTVSTGVRSVVEGCNFDGPVTISGSTEFTGNTLNSTLTASSKNIITDNHIESTADYAITLSGNSNTVTDNYLVSASKKGDAAVNAGSGTENIIQNNLPLDVDVTLDVEYDSIWLGNENIATVTINDATGSVAIKVNGKTVATPELNNGVATYTITASDIKGGENIVEATYMGVTETKTFYVYGVVTNETYCIYFNESNSGRLTDFVPEGATLDFQGKFLASADQLYVMDINKPVNIITSTNDAYIDLNTTAGTLLGDNPGNRFTVSNGGSGSNITGIKFHNTQIWVYNAHNVVLDNISNVIEDQRVGSGVGATSIRANSTYVTVKNSYFYTKNNGGSSSLVMAWADYCTFDNNTVEVEGNVGNLIYLTTFNVDVPEGVLPNQHNNITNNVVHRVDSGNYAICWGIVVGGGNNLIENNTVMLNSGTGITAQYGGASGAENNTYRGNKLYSASLNALPNSIVCDNYVEGSSITVATGGEAYNNTVVSGSITLNNAVGHDNNVGTIVLNGENASVIGKVNNLDVKSNVNVNGANVEGTLRFLGSDSTVSNSTVKNVIFGTDRSNQASHSTLANSTVTGTVTFTYRYGNENNLVGNEIFNLVTVNSNNNVITENTIVTNNDYAVKMDYSTTSYNNVSNNYLKSRDKTANDAILNRSDKNHILENNGPDLVLEDIPDSLMGDNVAVVTVFPAFRNTTVTIKVNDNIVNETEIAGTFEQVLKAGDLIVGENTVEVTAYGITKTTTFHVYEIIINVQDNAVMLGNDNTVDVNITSATGDVIIKVNGVEIATPTLTEGTVTQTISSEYIVYGENTVEVTYNGLTNSTTFKGITNIVTQDNFFDFFDQDGFILSNMPFDELIFQGEFSNLVEGIFIDIPLTITGDNAKVNNIPFYIFANDVVLDNLTFVADKDLETLIQVDGADNVNLTNLNITYTPEVGEGAVAINIIDSNNVNLLDSEIFFESHVTSDELLSVAIQAQNTQNVVIDNNNITTKLPCVYVNSYDADYYMMGSNNVNPVRLKDCGNLKFTNNNINSTTNDFTASFPTIQSIYIIGCTDSLIDHNNISMIDEMTPSGVDNYMYGINFGHNSNVTFSYNNFNMYTNGGKDAAGTNYAFQGVQSDVIIKGNNITSKSYGPNLGIYVASMFGETSELLIEDNFINITGYASSSGTWALVSGIEIQNGNAKIYNNTIYTYNVNEYDEAAYMYGISYAQWMYGDRSFDIQNNTVYTEGKYAVSTLKSDFVHVEGNTLYAHELAGDASVNAGESSDVIVQNNRPYIANITLDVSDSLAGADNTVTINVTNSATGNVTIRVNGKDVAVEEPLTDGVLTYTIQASDLVLGENNITVVFNGADDVLAGEESALFNVAKAASSIVINPIDAVTYPADVVVTFTVENETAISVVVRDADGNEVADGVDVSVAGQVTISGLNAGDYTIEITNAESDLFTKSNASSSFTVAQTGSEVTIDPIAEVTYPGDVVISFTVENETVISVVVRDADGNEVADGVDVSVAGQVTISGLVPGDYTISVSNADSTNVIGSSNQMDFTVLPAGSSVVITVPIDDVTYGDDAVITYTVENETVISVVVRDADGNEVADGVDVSVAGSVTVSGLVPGDYTIEITNAESDLFTESNDAASFTVVQAGSSVVINPIDSVAYPGDVVVTFTVENETAVSVVVRDADGNEVADGVDVSVAGSVTISGLAVGNYSITITNEKSDLFLNSSDVAEFSVIKTATSLSAEDITLSYKDGSAWTVTLTDSENNAISNAIVKINILGKDYSRVTDENGVASLPINLVPGTYDINATYDGNDIYEDAFINATVTVNKATAKLSAENIVMTYKDGSAWDVVLTDASGNVIKDATVKIGIVGKYYNIKTDSDGIVSLPINLASGNYTVNATLISSKYDAELITSVITVNKATPTLTGEDLIAVYKDGSAFNVILLDADGNAVAATVVKFTIAGKTYNIKTDANGVASLSINLPIGNYTVSAAFEGNSKLAPVEITNAIVVMKPELTIVANDLNMTYKDGTSYDVQLTDANGNAYAKANEVVKITINGKSYNRKTNADGIASLPINLGAGTYTITAEYEGKEITNTIVVNKA